MLSERPYHARIDWLEMTLDPLNQDALRELSNTLSTAGVHAFLRQLNARVAHRFTGVFRFDEPMLRSVRLFDRENPSLVVGRDVPLRQAYCSILHREQKPFTIENARTVPGLPAELATGDTMSYCGVPIGRYGALCHFDIRPRESYDKEIPLMLALADALLEKLRADGLVFPEPR